MPLDDGQLEFDFDEAELGEFKRAIQYEIDNLRGADVERAMEWGAYNMCRSARKVTPKSRKNAKRDLYSRTYTPKGKRRKKGVSRTWGVLVRTQQKPITKHVLHGSDGLTKAQAKKIEFAAVPEIAIGSAKNSWWGALRDVKKGIAGEKPKHTYSGVAVTQDKWATEMRVMNRLSYLLIIAPDVERTGLRNAAKAIVTRVDKKIGKEFNK